MNKPFLQDLRERFSETARVRLDEMTALLEQLRQDPDQRDALDRLATHFHGLAGMGTTCGFPRLSQLGDEGEGMILTLARQKRAPDTDTLSRWTAMVEEMRAALVS